MKQNRNPKPKYGIGERVLFNLPSEGNYAPRPSSGVIEKIEIHITEFGRYICYRIDSFDESFSEAALFKRPKNTLP